MMDCLGVPGWLRLLPVVLFTAIPPTADAQVVRVPWRTAEEAVSSFAVLGRGDQTSFWDLGQGVAVQPFDVRFAELQIARSHPGILLSRFHPAFGSVRPIPKMHVVGSEKTIFLMEPFEDDEVGRSSRIDDDLTRILYEQEGDLWLAGLDWGSDRVGRVDARQVTSVGLITLGAGNASTFLHWHDNLVFLDSRLSEEYPILRVDLATGAIEELARRQVFARGMFANPSGSRLCRSIGELLSCFDVATGEYFRVAFGPAAVIPRQAFAPEDPDSDHPSDGLWLDDDRLIVWEGSSRGIIAVVDIGQREVRVLYEAASGGDRSPVDVELLPGGRYLGLRLVPVERDDGPDDGRYGRLDLESGAVTMLPDDLPGDGVVWVDQDRVVFRRESGGLSVIGTWLHDIATGETERICTAPLFYFSPRNAWAKPVGEAIYYSSRAQGGGIFRAPVGDPQCTKVVDEGFSPIEMAPEGIAPSVLDAVLRQVTSVSEAERRAEIRAAVTSNRNDWSRAVVRIGDLVAEILEAEGRDPSILEYPPSTGYGGYDRERVMAEPFAQCMVNTLVNWIYDRSWPRDVLDEVDELPWEELADACR